MDKLSEAVFTRVSLYSSNLSDYIRDYLLDKVLMEYSENEIGYKVLQVDMLMAYISDKIKESFPNIPFTDSFLYEISAVIIENFIVHTLELANGVDITNINDDVSTLMEIITDDIDEIWLLKNDHNPMDRYEVREFLFKLDNDMVVTNKLRSMLNIIPGMRKLGFPVNWNNTGNLEILMGEKK
jgi:hypothetical protein